MSIYLTSQWIAGTSNVAPIAAQFFGSPQPQLAIPDIGSKHYLDLGFGWAFDDRLSVRFGVTNLTDTDAPNMANVAYANNTDALLFDVFGRSYYLGLSANFFE